MTGGAGVRPAVAELMDMTGRVAVVTGGAGEIGGTAAETFAELGAAVVVMDLGQERTLARAATLRERFGVAALGVSCDLESDSLDEPLRYIVDELGGIDVLVHAAALVGSSDVGGWIGKLEEQSVATWRRALEVNLTASFRLVQAAERHLRRSPAASVINVSSIYGSVGPDHRLYTGLPMGNPAAYAASKGGLEQLTRWLSTTLAPDVRVNAIAPGGIERGQPEEFRERYASRTPIGRLGSETDLKGAFAFLASDLSRYVTGQVLAVDGGFTTW